MKQEIVLEKYNKLCMDAERAAAHGNTALSAMLYEIAVTLFKYLKH